MRNWSVVLGALALLYASSGWGATAVWTGRSRQVQTVTYQWAWECEYNYNGQYFWRIFTSFCPSTIQVY